MLVDPISLNFLIAQITYATLKYLKNSGGLHPTNPPPGALPLIPTWGFAPVPKFELHIAMSPAQVRCTSTFFAAMACHFGPSCVNKYCLYPLIISDQLHTVEPMFVTVSIDTLRIRATRFVSGAS